MAGTWTTWLLGALLLVGTAACSDAPPEASSPQTEKFRQEVLGLLKLRVQQVKPIVGKGHPAVQKWLQGLYGQAIVKGAPLHYDQVVLNDKAKVMAWQGPDLPDFEQTYEADVGQDYSHFTKLDPVYKKHRRASFQIYSGYGLG